MQPFLVRSRLVYKTNKHTWHTAVMLRIRVYTNSIVCTIRSHNAEPRSEKMKKK